MQKTLHPFHKKLRNILVICMLLAVIIVSTSGIALANKGNGQGRGPIKDAQFYVPRPNDGALDQIVSLMQSHNRDDAKLIRDLIRTPQSVWFTQGTPESVEQDVRKTVRSAAAKKTIPVLVAYNIPFRDCAWFSAGGATTVEEYQDWIDGFAAGIGRREAIVILEPDGLGIIPFHTQLDGSMDWCQPGDADPETASAERFLMTNYAVDVFSALPNVSVYLDGTNSNWLNVPEMTDRLIKAGVQNADGFFLNVSNI
jgi:endoglucanase